MRNKNLLVFLLIILILGLGAYVIFNQQKNNHITNNIQTTVSTNAIDINQKSQLVFNGSDGEYELKECKESKDGQHKACIVIQGGNYYLVYDNNKSEAFDMIKDLEYHGNLFINSIYWSFNAIKNNINNFYTINNFDINIDLSSSGEEHIMLSPNLKTSIKINGTECQSGYVRRGDFQANYEDDSYVCGKYEIFKNNLSIGKYERVEELIFSPDSKSLVYIVGSGCSKSSGAINSWCKEYYVVNNGIKSASYAGVYNLVFSKDSKNLAYRVSDGKNFNVIYNGIKQTNFEYIYGDSLKLDLPMGKFSYIAGGDCFQYRCSGTGAGGSNLINCNEHFIISDYHGSIASKGLGPTPFFINKILYWREGLNCTPLRIAGQDEDSTCEAIEGGCQYTRIKSLAGFVGEKFDLITEVVSSPDTKHFAYVGTTLSKIKECECHTPSCEGLLEKCYTHQIIYDNNKRGDICEKLGDLSISLDNILHYGCWKEGDRIEKTLDLVK
jgi:hypothetical protein